MKKMLCCVVFLALSAAMCVPQDCKKTDYGADQQKYMETALQKFTACQLPLDNGCRAALAQALEQIYGVKDFGADSKYMTPAQIATKAAGDWEHLGAATDQEALKKAQSAANCGKAVIAVMSGENGGHVAIILPGPLTLSAGWKLEVPNSASFFTHNPGKSFAGKPLSYSFPKAEGIEIYAKK
ncbi:MAG: hypothetical protein LAO20_22805 [Acidobacteriia bacterium]|nr:hypothetical protein [Terriglobia bacterium]